MLAPTGRRSKGPARQSAHCLARGRGAAPCGPGAAQLGQPAAGSASSKVALLAAVKADAPDAVQRRRAVSAAKAYVGQQARFVGQQAVQLHGGMGVTDELIVSHHFKRLTLINASLGDADHHLGRFSELLLAA